MRHEDFARAHDQYLQPPDDDEVECNKCKGTGVINESDCCGDEGVDEDILICPSCHEHCGFHLCSRCDGTGFLTRAFLKAEREEEEADRRRDQWIDEEMGHEE